MQQYIVLKPISPPAGAIIEPAVPTAADPAPAPVLVDAGLFSGETDDERAANIDRLIAQGVIAPMVADPAPPLPTTRARPVARQNEE